MNKPQKPNIPPTSLSPRFHLIGGGLRRSFLAFTLVELIVVIVILAILATIAFLSFNSYSSSARDSTRLSDMSNISKGLILQYTKGGNYPLPDNYITINASGSNIGYQGYIGSKILGIINLSNGGKDPSDNTYYTYNTNINQNKYQIMGFLEDGSNTVLSNLIFKELNQTYSNYSNYSNRFPYTRGDQLGILLNSGTQLPIQYNNTNTGFELTTSTGTNYFAVLSKNNIIQSTGSSLGGLAGIYTTTSANSTYPGCDTADIKLSNGQIWAACNVGASQAYNGISPILTCMGTGCITDPYPTLRNMLGSYFQWGRNNDITSATSTSSLSPTGTLANNVGHTNFIMSGSANYDWIETKNDNLWGGSGTTNTGGTYYTQGQPSSMQGPCANGYHIPTIFESWSAMYTINPNLTNNHMWQNDTSIAIILKIPITGYRRFSDAVYLAQGKYGYWWTSSPIGNYAYYLGMSNTQIDPFWQHSRALGLPIRCLKN